MDDLREAEQPGSNLSRTARVLAGLGGVLLALTHALSAQAPYRIGPPPDWVTKIAPVITPPPASQVTDGYEILLVDRQEAVRASGTEAFKHVVYRVLDESAVQDNSQIEMVFDSSYQQLTLHSFTVIRNGRSIDQLKPDRIRVALREAQREYQVYDGSLSVIVLLEDVRPGDIIDYSYTRRGTNPVYAGHYMSDFTLQETVPVERVHFRLLWPKARELFVRRYLTSLDPAVRARGDVREYVWNQGPARAKVLDANLPDWYRPLPEIQLSDFASWSQVAAWGDSLFPSSSPLPLSLAAPLARIRSSASSTEDRVRGALRFAQEEVRYLGIELGVNSHEPYPLATVMRRRYGDCKDKALLLVEMLRALGVHARPALVSTDYGGHIRDFQPTARIFDHAIVQADFDGRVHWLDPTALYQRGDLESATRTYGAGLPLGPAVDSLSIIPDSEPPEPLTDVSMSWWLQGVGYPARMEVETRYRGRQADGMRSTFRTTSTEQLQRRFENFYAKLYPSIRSVVPPVIDDDETADVIRTTERYVIQDFWRPSREQEGFIGTLEPLELVDVVPATTRSTRTMPLAVTHPRHIRYVITAYMKEGWLIRPRKEAIETPALRFTYSSETQGKTLTLRYEYTTLADHVSPEAAAEHTGKLSQVWKLLTYNVTPPGARATLASWLDPQEVNWPILLAALLTFGVALLVALRLPHLQPAGWPTSALSEAPGGPSGLGGWLVLVGIIVVVTPVSVIVAMAGGAPTYTASSWARLTTPGTAAYNPLWAPILLFELVCNLGILVFSGLQLWLFFRRKRRFPSVFIWFGVARVIIQFLDAVAMSSLPVLQAKVSNEWSVVAGTTVGTALWVAYTLRSRRVRNTFVH